MPTRPFGIILLAGALLALALVGIFAFWAVLPRDSNTSPLAAIGLLLFPSSFLFPGAQLVVPSLVVIALVAALGYRYLRSHASRGPVATPPSP